MTGEAPKSLLGLLSAGLVLPCPVADFIRNVLLAVPFLSGLG